MTSFIALVILSINSTQKQPDDHSNTVHKMLHNELYTTEIKKKEVKHTAVTKRRRFVDVVFVPSLAALAVGCCFGEWSQTATYARTQW